MTNPLFGGADLPPEQPMWSVPPGMVAPPNPRDICECDHARDAHTWAVSPCCCVKFTLAGSPATPPLPRPDDAEAVERMARAMYEADGLYLSSGKYPVIPWAESHSLVRDEYLAMARAALLALWEGK